MSNPCLFPFFLAAATACAFSTPSLAQRSDERISRDMEFARQLAERFRYVDYAEEILGQLESEGLRGENLEGLGLVKCDVYAVGASREGNVEKRIELYDKAVAAYKSFLRDNPTSTLLDQAQRSYIELVNQYGRTLEGALADALGAEAKALREKTIDVLEDGLVLAGELASEGSTGLSQAEKNELYRLRLNQAQMHLSSAKVKEDGTFNYGRAESILETVAVDAGETSSAGLNAFTLLGKVLRAQGQNEDASDYLGFVAETAMPLDPDDDQRAWKDQSFDVRQVRFRLVELATADLVEALADAGDMESACMWAMHFVNGWKREGFDLSPLGYAALSSVARTLADSNGWIGGNRGSQAWFATEEDAKEAGFSGRSLRSAIDLALSTAQEINENNRGNTLQLRAQKLISDIISLPGVDVSPDILYEAAEGDYLAREYPRSIVAFKNVMRAVDQQDEATQREYAPKVLFRIGSALSRMDRDLEAAMAFREAATTWGGDPEYQRQVADGYFRSISEVRRDAGSDPIIERMYLDAESLVEDAAKDTGGADEVRWRKAERYYAKKDYASAREGYLEVSAAYDDYERALSKAALCLFKMKDYGRSKKEFESYADQFVKKADNAVTGAARRSARHQARAQAIYYLGALSFSQNKFDEALGRLTGYEKEFGDQESYAANALFLVTRCWLGKGDLEKAMQAQALLQETFPSHTRVGFAARYIADACEAEVDRLEKAKDEEGALAMKVEQARYTGIQNEYASTPAFPNLRAESRLWLETGQWENAEQVLRRIQGVFGKQAERAGEMTNFILPDLGWALLEQERVPEAFEILDPLIPKTDDDTRKPRSDVVRRWCRAVTGWVSGDENQVREHPGVGGADNLGVAVDYLQKLTDSQKNRDGAWNCPWYELKFEMAYGYYVWGKEDSSKQKTAKGIVQDLINNFDDVRMGPIGEACGDKVLQKRFQWLWNKVK